MTKASDCKCIICGKQAVAFWPVIDPDNQYAVTMRVHNQKELDGVLRDRHMGYLIDWPKLLHV